MSIDPKDLEITQKSVQRGGQQVGLNRIWITVTHKPTGIAVKLPMTGGTLRTRDLAFELIELAVDAL